MLCVAPYLQCIYRRAIDSQGQVSLFGPREVLSGVFGRRLHYPASFIGRGDMSRGGLLLRSARAGAPLDCVVLDPSAPRRGARPPKLAPLPAS